MRNLGVKNVVYSYSYLQENNAMDGKLFMPTIIEKLPKIKLNLPKISLCENLELSFC